MVNRGVVGALEVNRGVVGALEVNRGVGVVEGQEVNREELTSISNRKNQVHLLQKCFHEVPFLF